MKPLVWASISRIRASDVSGVIEAVGDGLVTLHVIGEGQIGNDHSIHTDLGAPGAEGLEAITHDRVEIAHQDHRHLDLMAHIGQLVEEAAQGHAVAQRLRRRRLDDRSVGHRVGEWNADLHQVDAVSLERT